MDKDMPNVGDVLSSPSFAFGYHHHTRFLNRDTEMICVDGKSTKYIVNRGITEEERIAYIVANHKEPPFILKEFDLGAYDVSRGTAKFVVEQLVVENTEGGNSFYDTHTIIARKLHPSGLYNPEGELIYFYFPRGTYGNSVSEVTIHGTMRRVFI